MSADVSSANHDAVVPQTTGETKQVELKHLKTLAEVRAGHETVNVYIVAIPKQSASTALNILREAGLDRSSIDFQHLRRFGKPDHLPLHVRQLISSEQLENETIILFVCPQTQIGHEDLLGVLNKHGESIYGQVNFRADVHTIPVPSHAPTSATQAADWSQRYWPISYKNTNPYGPHPALVSRAEIELQGADGEGVSAKLALARLAAQEAHEAGIGEQVGCVVVARNQLGFAVEEVVVVAGDARRCNFDARDGPGNVMAHAVLRAIALVARKRLRIDHTLQGKSGISEETSKAYAEEPLTAIEAQVFALDNLASNGYLCAELEIYLTHEPCVMCSMAILHSRFLRCVFGRRMPLTGAMTADDGGLGHGLFWRPAELNWKFLCWQAESRTAETSSEGDDVKEDINT